MAYTEPVEQEVEDEVGYRIDEKNILILANLSGIPAKTLRDNVGWYILYSKRFMPRWLILPRKALVTDENFAKVTIHEHYFDN